MAHYARKKEGEVVQFSSEARKSEPPSLLFASAASKIYIKNFISAYHLSAKTK
jgi:hypothetical protein